MRPLWRVLTGIVCLATVVTAQSRLPRRAPQDVEAQVAALAAADPAARAAAACRLGWMGSRAADAAPTLTRLLTDVTPVNVTCVSDARGGVMPNDVSTSPAREAIRALGLLRDASTLPALLPLLTHADAALRAEAVTAVGRFRDPSTYEVLVTAVRDQSIAVRERAVIALGNLRDRRAVSVLAPLLADPDPAMREHAVVALGALRDPQAIDPLIGALQDPDALVRERAAVALRNATRAFR